MPPKKCPNAFLFRVFGEDLKGMKSHCGSVGLGTVIKNFRKGTRM
jgi:hypothetical protein